MGNDTVILELLDPSAPSPRRTSADLAGRLQWQLSGADVLSDW